MNTEVPRVEHDLAGWWAVMKSSTGAEVRIGPYDHEANARYVMAVSRFGKASRSASARQRQTGWYRA